MQAQMRMVIPNGNHLTTMGYKQAFRSLMYNGLWKSRVLHELFDQGDPGVMALVDEFKRLNAMHQMAIKAPPVQLAIEGPRAVLDTHTNGLCLEGTRAPMAIEWPQEDHGPGGGNCGGGSGLANQTGQTGNFGNFGGAGKNRNVQSFSILYRVWKC